MTQDGWRELVVQAQGEQGEALDLLARLLAEQDLAKEYLRRKGYGCVGTPWPDVVAEVPDRR